MDPAQAIADGKRSAARRRTEFALTVEAPYATVAPLFGAHAERAWAADWNPRFIHPLPARDEPGAVFLLDGEPETVWIASVFDLETGHVQYVHFAAGLVVTRIDIRVQAPAPNRTSARVLYERTASRPEGVDLMNQLADDDATKQAHWESALNDYCARSGAREP